VDVQRITPGTVALLWRLAGVILLCGLWLAGPKNEIGLMLVLFLATLGLARWRFPLPAWTTLVDQAACTAAMWIWPQAALAFALPVFDACLAVQPWFALPALVALFAFRAWSLPATVALAVAGLAGLATHLWRRQLRAAREEADRDRRERYELESLKAELLSANVRVARMAEVAERSRIARDLHDHAGHEITAAGLALDAYRGLREAGDPQADELLDEARRRVADGMEILRRTARGISPGAPVGVGSLEEICRRYSACPVIFTVHGDTSVVPAPAWGVLEPCLKEALTNASRHEAPPGIDVSLDVGPHIVRLCVHNPLGGLPYRHDQTSVAHGRGLGLRSLAQRAGAMGGSVTTDVSDGFRLVCVLPLGWAAAPPLGREQRPGRDEPPDSTAPGAPPATAERTPPAGEAVGP
jgi:two-component system sensor histidine kinase DesK